MSEEWFEHTNVRIRVHYGCGRRTARKPTRYANAPDTVQFGTDTKATVDRFALFCRVAILHKLISFWVKPWLYRFGRSEQTCDSCEILKHAWFFKFFIASLRASAVRYGYSTVRGCETWKAPSTSMNFKWIDRIEMSKTDTILFRTWKRIFSFWREEFY